MKVPTVVGLSQKEAEKALRDAGIKPVVKVNETVSECEPGTVIRQSDMSFQSKSVRGVELDPTERHAEIEIAGKQAKPKAKAEHKKDK